tara:strand:- start:270 stop:464 length:195 start_codon:yes stop_codon:yes gene_type:complete
MWIEIIKDITYTYDNFTHRIERGTRLFVKPGNFSDQGTPLVPLTNWLSVQISDDSWRPDATRNG